VVSGNTIANIHDVYSDGLKNWGQQRYYDVGMEKLANGNYSAATRSKKNEFTGRIMQVNHELMDISKKILSATSTNCKIPGNETYVAIIYIVRKAFDLPSIPNPPRLKASTSALAENLLHKYTAQGALDVIMQQNFMGNDVNMMPTKNQLEDKARRMEDRKPIKKQGAPKKENREIISKWIHEGHFVRSHYITSETERFLLFTRASQSLFEKSTLSRSVVVSLADEANKLRNRSEQERLEFAKKLINTKQYVDLQKAGMCFVDTTFTVSRLYLTIILCMYGKTNISICVHILAIDIKFPEFKIVDQIVKYLEEESEAQRIKRITDQKDGNKESSSRRSGSKLTRNRKRKIDEIVDTTYSPTDTDNFIKESGPSLSPLAPKIMHRTGIDRLPRPPIRPQVSHITVIQPAQQSLRQPLGQPIHRVIQQPIQRPIGQIIPQVIQEHIPRHLVPNQRRTDDNPHTTETEEVREALKHFFSSFPHHRSNMKNYWNGYPFEIGLLKNVSNYKQRKCVHCTKPLDTKQDNIVIIHHEVYEYTVMEGGHNTKKWASGLRTICTSTCCLRARYPYVTEFCFFSNLNPSDTQKIIDKVLLI
jgi:hypothetical protein